MNGKSRPKGGSQTPAKKSESSLPAASDNAWQQAELGEVIREEGIARGDAGTDSWWRDCCDRGIAEMVSRGVVFQAADLHDLGVPDPDHPNRWGPRLLAAARAGVIVPVDYGPSRRPSTACSAVRLWSGARDQVVHDEHLDRDRDEHHDLGRSVAS